MVSTVLHGEAGSVNGEAMETGLEELRKVCNKYGLETMLNIDETGVLYGLLPNPTYLSKAQKRKPARGTKGMKAKYRVSAYMCTNATGTAKVPMSIIGKPKTPRCFRVTPSPIKYFAQANALSDGAMFKKWWLEVVIPFIRKWTHLRVLYLIDGYASHDLLVDPTGQITTMV